MIGLLSLFFLISAPQAYSEEVAYEGYWSAFKTVEKRGWINLVTFPMDFPTTLKEETEKYPKTWIVTTIPHTITRSLTRLSSALNDIFLMPLYAPFSKDTTALTKHFDLPDYGWEDV